MLLKQCFAVTLFQPDSKFGRFPCFLALGNIDVKNFGVNLHNLIAGIPGANRP
jgi:hypothetical protein